MIGFKQEGGIMKPQFTIKPFDVASLAVQTANKELGRIQADKDRQQALYNAEQQRLKDELDVEFTDKYGIDTKRNRRRYFEDIASSQNPTDSSKGVTNSGSALAPVLISKPAIAVKPAMSEEAISKQETETANRGDVLKTQDLEKRIAESKTFNDAFRTARQAGLKTFKWKGGLYGTQLASEVKPAAEAKSATAESSDTTSSFTKLVDDAKAETTAQAAKAASARVASSAPLMPRTPIKTNPAMTEDQISQQEAVMQQRREMLKKLAVEDAPFYEAVKQARNEKMNTFNWRGRDYATQLPETWTPRWTSPLNISIIPTNKVGGRINYFQQGGTASSAQQEQANAFMQAILQGDSEAIGQLIQAANKGDKQATQLIETILKEDQKGNQQVTKAAAVIKQLLSQTVQAKWGAKLGYVKSLKYAKGGKTCPACEQKVEMKKCGGKKAKKRYFGGLI